MVRRLKSRNTSIFFLSGLFVASIAAAEPTWYVVSDDDVKIRCGADSSYYAFTLASEGDRVEVIGEKYNWARVRTVGSVFDDSYGYIKYPESEGGRFEVSEDGQTGQTLGATPILAPNLNSDDLAYSWRQLCILPRGETLNVIETYTIKKDGLHAVPHVVHRVSLPPQAEGWVNMADLRPAMAPESTITESQTDITDDVVVETEDVSDNDVVIVENVEMTTAITMGEVVQTSTESDTIESPEEQEPHLLVQWIEYAEQDVMIEELVVDDAQDEVEIVVEPETFLTMIETAYAGVVLSDLDIEELHCLQEDFITASEEEENPVRAQYALMRAQQIDVYTSLQGQDEVIGELQTRIERSRQNAADRDLAISNTGDYEVVGLLSVSSVFNGNERPLLYRIQDPKTSRTLAYLRPQEDGDHKSMVGQNIGVMGHLNYDATLQVNIIVDSRIDLMASNTAYVPVD
jgi:uncharacterized protein YraI